MHEGADFQHAITKQYLRGMLSRGGSILLLSGLCLNLVVHHWLFNIVSDTFKIYRSMTAILFGLSIDFFSLALISASAVTYQRFRSGNIYRDLNLSGIAPWPALRPLLSIVFCMSFAAGLVQSLIGALLSDDVPIILMAGIVAGGLYGLVTASFTSLYIVLANILRLPLMLQLIIELCLAFLLMLAFDGLTTFVHPYFDAMPRGNQLIVFASGGQPETWPMLTLYYSYYTAILLQGVALVPVAWLMYRGARTLAPRILL